MAEFTLQAAGRADLRLGRHHIHGGAAAQHGQGAAQGQPGHCAQSAAQGRSHG